MKPRPLTQRVVEFSRCKPLSSAMPASIFAPSFFPSRKEPEHRGNALNNEHGWRRTDETAPRQLIAANLEQRVEAGEVRNR